MLVRFVVKHKIYRALGPMRYVCFSVVLLLLLFLFSSLTCLVSLSTDHVYVEWKSTMKLKSVFVFEFKVENRS